jgi:hypothetical protein
VEKDAKNFGRIEMSVHSTTKLMSMVSVCAAINLYSFVAWMLGCRPFNTHLAGHKIGPAMIVGLQRNLPVHQHTARASIPKLFFSHS